MENDELYNKYLESVFYYGDETYFYNVKTQEIVPDHLTLDSVSYYFLNYIIRCTYDIYDIFGKPINNTISNEIFLSCVDDYLLTKSSDAPRTFKVYDIHGKVIAVFTNEPEKLDIHFPYLTLENDKVILKDKVGGRKIQTFEIKNKINKVSIKDKKAVDIIFQKFNISKNFKQELKSNNKLENLYYNANFLMITALTKFQEVAVVVIRMGECPCQNRIICYDQLGFEAKFNNERCLIFNDSLSYYDINGVKIAEYKRIDKEDVVPIDYTVANLLTSGRLKLKLKKHDKIGYINNKKYTIIKNYCCNRLLVRNEQGLYGYLDEFGKEVIKPQFAKATPFSYGWAIVDGKEIDIDGKVCEYVSPYTNLRNSDSYISLHSEIKNYYGLVSENAYREGLWSYDYSKYLKVLPPKNNPFKKAVYYYVDYKTKKIVKTEYEPLRQYENFVFFTITKNFYWQDGYYLFDKRDNSYHWFANHDSKIEFYDDYFTWDNKTYYVTDQIICLGDFNLENRLLKKDCTLLSKEKYLIKYQKFISKNMITAESINKKINEYQQYSQKIAECQKQIDELEMKKRELTIKMNTIPNHTLEIPSNFYYEENGVKYVSKEYANYLSFFDLLTFDFTGFDVSNLDFTGTNAFINPQTIYNKNMANGNYSDVTFISYDFSGIDMTNATFNNDFIVCYQEKILRKKLTK